MVEDLTSCVRLRLCQRLECVVAHWAAEASDTAQECPAGTWQAVVGRFEDVMLTLDEVAAHVQPLSRSDVAGCWKSRTITPARSRRLRGW